MRDARAPHVVGWAGEASGRRLDMHKCDSPTSACAASATARCRDLAGCDVVELKCHNATHCARAVLRRAWSGWGAPDYLHLQLKQCRQIARDALATKPHSALPRGTLDFWSEHTCEEYADGGHGRPQLGGVVQEAPSLDGCPPRDADFIILAYQSRADKMTCAFASSLAFHRLPATVLGWDPDGPKRPKFYFFAGKIYALVRYLSSCALPAHAVVLISDTDVVAQADLASLRSRTLSLLASQSASAVVGTEIRCLPHTASERARRHAELLRPGMPASWPRCLNAGQLAGRVPAVLDLLNRTCRSCRLHGVEPRTYWRRFHREYSWVLKSEGSLFRNQPEMTEAYLGSAKADGLTLDFEQLLFHSNHWQDPRRDVYLDEAAALLRSRRTNSTPAFLHYNGYTKEGTVWRWPVSIDSVMTFQRTRHAADEFGCARDRHALNCTEAAHARRRAALESFLERNLTFVDHLHRRRRVDWRQLCATAPPSWKKALGQPTR